MDELAQVFSAPFLNRNHQHDDYVEIVPSLQISSDHHQGNTAAASLRLDAFGVEEDFSDATLMLINQMLMEEDDLQNKPCMFQECLALQATENSFSDALGNDYLPPPPDQNSLGFDLDRSFSIGLVDNLVNQSNWLLDRDFYSLESVLPSVESHSIPLKVVESSDGRVGEEDENNWEKSPKKKTRGREDGGDSAADGRRSNKQLASFVQDSDDQFDMYDKVLLCPLPNPNLHQDNSSLFLVQKEPAKGSNVGGRGRFKKERSNENEVGVDLMNLLSLCAQAISNTDHKSAYDLLNRIRQHSSPYCDGIERLGHYFGNALEARLAGTGAALYASFTTKRISTADILRGYEVYVKACPFNWLSNGYANRSIEALVQDSPRLHVIDFGIMYGFQWPSLIQDLSMRPGGPPRLKITGIDLPQPGFRPSERVEETRRRLATYCDRFGVPFQFNAIAKKWESINLDDLKIESDEVVVVNCMFRLRNVPDETIEGKNCPRDTVLNLVKMINPDTFIHGVLNGGCDAPFFTMRFKEALTYSAGLFDMFEATVPREDEGRRMYEKEVWGKAIMNVIACEDAERVERPETYKQWQVRNARVGFRQLPLNQEILRELKGVVRLRYNKNFTVEEDGKWMLQGWKGRIMFALSCWKPIKEL